MLLAILAVRSAFAGDVVLNEVLYDPTGTDTGAEWVELCNRGTSEVDLTGWNLEAAGTSFASIYTFPAISISPGQHLLIGAGSPYALVGTMQNGGTESDGVRLSDSAGLVQDTVIYDSPNSNGLFDDGGEAATELLPDVVEGHSLARLPDCRDTDDTSDFVDSSTPTPGAENVAGSGGDTGGGGGTADCSALDVVINEYLPDPASEGGDDGYEWVELYNPSGADIDLSGWTLINRKSEASSRAITLPTDTWILAGDFLVVGESAVPEADVVADLDLGNDTSSVDEVVLECDGAAVDIAVYGGTNDLGWLNEDGLLATSGGVPAAGRSIGRVKDGVDTNDCATDFTGFEYPTPGLSNAASGETDCAGMDQVKINEFIPNPAKPKDATDEAPEWIELFNAGTETYALDGWSLRYGTSPSSEKTIDISGLVEIAPGDHLVVGEKGAENVDLVVTMDMGAASSNSDRLQLRHCGNGVADTVVYGSPNSDEWTDDTLAVASSLAPKPGDGETLQRVQDGYDTDASGTDWVISESPTPGAANPVIEPVICSAGTSTVKVNEIFPNPDSTDTGNEWVELYNAGDAAQRLDGWTIETGTSSWGTDFTFPGGIELQPGAFLLIGGTNVPGDLIASSLSLGNASKAPDGVRLVDCEATVQDTVLYGDALADVEDTDLMDDRGEYSMVAMPSSGRSAGRIPDGQDTDISANDLQADLAPTPGAPNVAGTTDSGGGTTPIGKGCGAKGGSTGGSAKKCGVVDPVGGLGWMLLAVVAVRRRRADRERGADRKP